jgi:hypothetical protein
MNTDVSYLTELFETARAEESNELKCIRQAIKNLANTNIEPKDNPLFTIAYTALMELEKAYE